MFRFAAIGIAAASVLSACLAHADALAPLQLRLNGHASAVGAYVDQSNMDGLDYEGSEVSIGVRAYF